MNDFRDIDFFEHVRQLTWDKIKPSYEDSGAIRPFEDEIYKVEEPYRRHENIGETYLPMPETNNDFYDRLVNIEAKKCFLYELNAYLNSHSDVNINDIQMWYKERIESFDIDYNNSQKRYIATL